MPAIPESYASPNLRAGLLLDDHPTATFRFEMVTGTSLGIPERMGGDRDYCLCTISFNDGVRPDRSAWKPVGRDEDTPDEWNKLCTKTLGRALKRAGYPDDMGDLKALVVWRQRTAEIGAINAGHVLQAALPSAAKVEANPNDPAMAALNAAARPDGDDETSDAEIVDESLPSADEAEAMRADLHELRNGLDPIDLDDYEDFARHIGADIANPAAEHLSRLLGWFDPDND